MNKIILTALMILPSINAFATDTVDLEQVAKERLEWTKKHFAAQGTAIPDGGVTVLPEKQMSEYKTFKDLRAKNKADIKKYGYIREALPQIQSLLNFKSVSKHAFSKGSINNSNNGELHHNISEIYMAYTYHGVPESEISESLGIAPSVTYIQGKGWAGAMQFFEKKGLGNCSYRENNLSYSHGAAIIPEEDVTKDVNGKITVASVTGKKGFGFMYNVDWYDNSYFRELKCAQADYSADTMSTMLELARQIDNNTANQNNTHQVL